MLAVGGLPVFNVVVVKFYINCMVAINRCMIVLVLILIYTSLTVNYSYLRIIRLTMHFTLYNYGYPIPRHKLSTIGEPDIYGEVNHGITKFRSSKATYRPLSRRVP